MSSRIFISTSLFLGVLFTGCGSGKENKDESKDAFSSEVEKMSYAIGVNMGNSVSNGLEQQGIDSASVEMIAQGVIDRMDDDNELLIHKDSTQQIIRSYMQKAQERVREENRKKGEEFVQKKVSEEGLEKAPQGFHYKVLEEGGGSQPDPWDSVRVHYHGTKVSGDVFDSSVDRGSPAEFPVSGGIIRGWTEALQMMKEGGKWKIFLPSDLAYGAQGRGDIQPGETLIFEIELIEVLEVDSADAANSQGMQGQGLSPAQIQQLKQQQRGRGR